LRESGAPSGAARLSADAKRRFERPDRHLVDEPRNLTRIERARAQVLGRLGAAGDGEAQALLDPELRALGGDEAGSCEYWPPKSRTSTSSRSVGSSPARPAEVSAGSSL